MTYCLQIKGELLIAQRRNYENFEHLIHMYREDWLIEAYIVQVSVQKAKVRT